MNYKVSPLWEKFNKSQELYSQESFQTTSDFLFGVGERCQYLKVAAIHTNAWFQRSIQVETPTKSTPDFAVKLAKNTGIELFLQPSGVGILSLSFEVVLPHDEAIPLNDFKRYNYYLAQLQRTKTALIFSLQHPFEKENFKGDRSKILPPPRHDAPFEARLGKQGGRFYMIELCDFLLQDIENFSAVQQQFSIYTVASFDQSVDFSATETRQQMGSFLSGLAQIEEVAHAGHIEGERLDIVNHVMNRKHWAAMSFMGAAHLIAAQGVEFDTARVAIVFRKYFIPYLVGYLQRLILQRLLNDARHLIHKETGHIDDFCQLHAELLDFNVTGLLTEVSSREALNRYYRMGQETFSIDQNTQRVNQAIRSYDANNMSKGLAENIQQISKVQGSVEWFEVLFITGATAELAGHVAKGTCYNSISMVLAPIVACLLSLYILRPWKTAKQSEQRKKSTLIWIIIIFILISLWWIGGFYFAAYYTN